MCENCGCGATVDSVRASDGQGGAVERSGDSISIELSSRILRENDDKAAHNRAHFDAHSVLTINLMSSPGSGKTSLLEAVIEALGNRYRIAVIEGDLETENDARRIRMKGVPAIQITTGQTCHLDARMVHDALHALNLDDIDILFIENVGNLVCPASFDLGQHENVVLLATTEGDDKPAKYPVMFRVADLVLLSKSDLLDFIDDFSPEKAEKHLRALANDAGVIAVSARRPETLAPFIRWLEAKLTEKRSAARPIPRVEHFHFHAVDARP